MRKLIAGLREEFARTDEHGAIAVALYIAVAACVPQLALWSLLFHLYDVDLSASLFCGWAVFSLCGSVVVAARRNWFSWFLAAILFCTAVLNALASSELGGISNSAGQIMWGLLAPMAALLFYGLRKAVYWFILFLALVIIVQVSPPLGPPVYPEAVHNALFAANLAIIGTLVFLTIAYVLNKKEVFYRLLQREEEKTTALLHNVLPESIARDLKENAVGFARQYDEATILFLDLVGFTPLAAANGAEKTVALLNTIYSEFDRLAAEYGVEKIKTIGDSYMAVSGLPEPRSDHAPAAARLALAMADFLDDWTDSTGRGVSYRIGLNSGPVAAGVIGIQRFAFDVWGDAVNLASRMESHGMAGRIHIAGRTRELLDAEFETEARGVVDVKGFGGMHTWFLGAANQQV